MGVNEKNNLINQEKTTQILLWIISKFNGKIDFHKLFKILYFAEQKHLVRFGRLIIGDKFVAMKDGPVPSEIYYELKKLRQNQANQYFTIKNWCYITAKQEPDLDEISDSEICCLEESVQENKDLTHSELSKKSHQMAWENANEEDYEISFWDIAKEGGANAEMLKYITLNLEIQNQIF